MKDTMRSKLTQLVRRLEEIDQNLQDPDVTSNMDQFRALSKERAEIEPVVLKAKEYEQAEEDLAAAEEMLSDEEMKEFASEEIKAAKKAIEQISSELEILLLPKDPNDSKNVIMEIRAGTGGNEAAIFAGELFRMYVRYAENRKWKTEIISASESDLGGFKEVIFMVTGQGAYSRFKFESGTHRVQRVPVTESNGKIQTSAATVAVLPEADKVDVNIDMNDVRIDVFRASGNGGQCVNTTDSAVRVTHIPTGIVVSCQDEKSQLKNKDKALKVLYSRIYKMEQEKHDNAISENRRQQVGSGDRSEKIRTYNFPQGRVTDHRAGITLYKIDAVMNGDLDDIIDVLTAKDQAEKMQALGEK